MTELDDRLRDPDAAGEDSTAATEPFPATVVIATRGRPQMLLDTISSILKASRVPREIVVVDQSERPHAELAESGEVRGCRLRYVHSPPPGVSRARNLGFQLADNELVVLFDDDLLIGEDSIERLLDGMSDGDARVVVTGRVLAAAPERPGLTQAHTALITRSEPAVFRGRQPLSLEAQGTNVVIPRSLMIEIGGFDERLGPGTRFPGAEDGDLLLRLLDADCEVRHVPEAVVLHRAWRSKPDLLRVRWRYARGVGALYAKHASIRDRYVLGLAAHEVKVRTKAAASAAFSSPATTAGQLLSLFGLMLGAIEWVLRHGRGRLSTRASGDHRA